MEKQKCEVGCGKNMKKISSLFFKPANRTHGSFSTACVAEAGAGVHRFQVRWWDGSLTVAGCSIHSIAISNSWNRIISQQYKISTVAEVAITQMPPRVFGTRSSSAACAIPMNN